MTAVGLAQFGCKAEVTYGTPVVVDRFWPFVEDTIMPEYAVVSASDEIRAGSIVERQDQNDPYIAGCAGDLKVYVPTKGFGLALSHALGSSSVGVITDSNYTQSHTLSATGKNGKSLTGQSGRPFNPSGTVQPFQWKGLKILSLELEIETEGFLKSTITFDGMDVDTAPALATATYPALANGASKFPWRLAALTIGGSQVEIINFKMKLTWPMNVSRRMVRGSALKKEPVPAGKPTIEWSGDIEFTDLTQYNRVASQTIAGRCTPIVLTCSGTTALAGATVPQLVATISSARFDQGLPGVSGEEPLNQSISGVGLDDAASQPLTITYRTTDAAV